MDTYLICSWGFRSQTMQSLVILRCVLQRTASNVHVQTFFLKKGAYAKLLFCPLEVLFFHVLLAAVDVVCLRTSI